MLAYDSGAEGKLHDCDLFEAIHLISPVYLCWNRDLQQTSQTVKCPFAIDLPIIKTLKCRAWQASFFMLSNEPYHNSFPLREI